MAVRQNVGRLADWDPIILWYALAIRELQTRAPDVGTSWRYLAAIHGFDYNTSIAAGVITAQDPLPPRSAWNGPMWNQCQHASWYFLPWHRGYLAAFEIIVAQTIVDLGGPADWALPYWNYFDEGNPNARNYPPAFLAPTLPDGSANPLSAPPRYPATALAARTDVPEIHLRAMGERRFTSPSRGLGLGGVASPFHHFSGPNGGALELNPHNAVHVMIGGFMADPNLAGLDPIFWLHHCNIDRLWAAWLARPGKVQEASAAFLDGPSPRGFTIPNWAGVPYGFTPRDTLPGEAFAPTYDDLNSGTNLPAQAVPVDSSLQGAPPVGATYSSTPPPSATLSGANAQTLQVGADWVATGVQMAADMSLTASAPAGERVVLNLENVRGTAPSAVLSVWVGTPAVGDQPAGQPEFADAIALFGLAKASTEDENDGGQGLSAAIDVTEAVQRFADAAGGALDQLVVYLQQPGVDGDVAPVQVDRVSLYRQSDDFSEA